MLNKLMLKNLVPVICLLLVVSFWACTPAAVNFQRSWEVSRTFESFKVLPGYTYYYNGQPSNPDAIVGIAEPYELVSPHWHKVALKKEKMQRFIESILNTEGVVPDRLEAQGARILNDDGEPIGIWYSAWEEPSIITFQADKKIYMSQPQYYLPALNREPIG